MPSKFIFRITWGVLLLYLTIDFANKADNTFIQLAYDWKNINIIKKGNGVIVDSISHDYVVLRNNFYNTELLNPFYTFSLSNENERFFRTSKIIKTETKIIFSGVKWINGKFNKTNKKAEFRIIDLPLIQSGNKKIVTIGDSQIIWRGGRDFRKNLSKNENLFFIGNKRDIYGYPHEASLEATCEDVLKSLRTIAPARSYILFLGAHDKKTDKHILTQILCKIFDVLQNRRETQEIFVITLPPSPNMNFDEYNTSFNEILLRCSKKKDKIKIVDLYKNLEDKYDYLTNDEVHLNQKGYSLLNRLLLKQLK